MKNKDIARQFDLLARIMELHDENPFKIRSYANAYLSLRKMEGDLSAMSREKLSAIPGVGDAITDKITELLQTGKMRTLEKYKDITPLGVQEMLSIRGLGPKKVKQIWKEMGITTVGELLYACNENRLIEAKGFGLKTQDEIRKKIEYFVDSKGKYLFASIESAATSLLRMLQNTFSDALVSLTGECRRLMPEVSGIEIISTLSIEETAKHSDGLEFDLQEEKWKWMEFPVLWTEVSVENFYSSLFKSSCSESFLIEAGYINGTYKSEEEIFSALGLQYVVPEYREHADTLINARSSRIPELLDVGDIKGIIHNHSTYSDGLHSLKDMAGYVKNEGFEYFVISDHSRSAFYAHGMETERVLMQFDEIDLLNQGYTGFRIFKGIESDILVDGSLDYPDDILSRFEVVIASVHSVLNMDESKATERLIRAIENPYTRILGHPTGRLLLAREGYPLDFRKVIDACAANNVVIELNANPQRLDLDWKWIDAAMSKGVMIAVNPDAHSKESVHYIKYGVYAGRKGGLTAEMCLNTLNLAEFSTWVDAGK
jgi:DNA polymerase (family X)